MSADQVGAALLERLPADEPGGFRAERREVDFGRPLGRVAADEYLGHPVVGEDRLEEGVVQGVSVMDGDSKMGEGSGRLDGWMGMGPLGSALFHDVSERITHPEPSLGTGA